MFQALGALVKKHLNRRSFLVGGSLTSLGLLGTQLRIGTTASTAGGEVSPHTMGAFGSGYQMIPGGEKKVTIPPEAIQLIDPLTFLTYFDYGKVTRLPDGQVEREYTLVAIDREIEVAPGVMFPAWTFNGTVPGPTLRCTEGDRVKIQFVNAGSMPHTIHFHGIHPANMDGVFEIVPPDGSYLYEFTAEPYGLFLYHCHVMPLKKHIHKGLYGTFIVDPPTPRPPATEMIMVMNGFDTDFDGENEFYTVNGIANYYADHPIVLKVDEFVRLYLVNMTEFDLINSFHLHANMFQLYRTGTSLTPHDYTDTVMLCQGERCILEFSYKYPGKYMFHAHQSEFAELGWMGFFEVRASNRHLLVNTFCLSKYFFLEL